ncbi:MAG TPA: hypothetical protein VLU46_08235 [Thermoanaerobaculia bacterium]|nr:hypothetical protein [Thermoanaerobaculia bacterium]
MTTFTTDAQQLFDRYLQTVRWSVRGVADPGEIERDVREHVTTALESQDEPVTSQTLREVLSRLGDPWQWVAPEDLPAWRRIMMRFALGPEDWRLAYACFGLTLLGLMLMPVGIGAVLLIGAYFLGRATYALVVDRDGTLGARAWLVYPPLVFWAVGLAIGLLAGPIPPLAAAAISEHYVQPYIPRGANEAAYLTGVVMMMTGGWWVVLSGLVAAFPRATRALLLPLANRFRRVHALWLTGLGVLALGGGFALMSLW